MAELTVGLRVSTAVMSVTREAGCHGDGGLCWSAGSRGVAVLSLFAQDRLPACWTPTLRRRGHSLLASSHEWAPLRLLSPPPRCSKRPMVSPFPCASDPQPLSPLVSLENYPALPGVSAAASTASLIPTLGPSSPPSSTSLTTNRAFRASLGPKTHSLSPARFLSSGAFAGGPVWSSR